MNKNLKGTNIFYYNSEVLIACEYLPMRSNEKWDNSIICNFKLIQIFSQIENWVQRGYVFTTMDLRNTESTSIDCRCFFPWTSHSSDGQTYETVEVETHLHLMEESTLKFHPVQSKLVHEARTFHILHSFCSLIVIAISISC